MEAIQELELIIEQPSMFKKKPKDDDLGFGTQFTDRMLFREFKDGSWQIGSIIPFKNFELSPATIVFHYGQEIFEGLKAFRQENNQVVMFRPDENAKRFKKSAIRMVMQPIEESYFVESIKKLVSMEKDWVPKKRGTALYIRPTLIATEPKLGVAPSSEYYFYTILSPSGPYFPGGFAPTRIKVEDYYIRAALGGTGEAKAGGNYASSLLAAKKAKEEGFAQVLWLDSNEKRFVEEVGAMNIAFVLDDTIYTPPLSGTILPGITRKSVITLASDLGIPLKEEALAIDVITESIKSGNLTEIFGIGTAASIAPVGVIKYKSEILTVNEEKIGKITQQIYNELTGIQYGNIEDRHGWIHPVS
ncbi:MAG: branched-chain amino acid aminotransferase [Candidatus Kariarchaeaceae archaeon]